MIIMVRFTMEVTVIIIVLASLIVAGTAQFTVQPLSVERAEGLEAVFRCQYQAEGLTVTYDWVIDNEIVATDTETVRARRPPSPGEPTTLTIVATPQHNNSVVYCEADIRNGTDRTFEISSTASLVVRETIITYLIVAPNTITVKWNAVPLTEYRVDINRTTLGSTEIMVHGCASMCEVVADEYIFMYSNTSVCDRFSFTVTPTEGEMRGTTSEPDTGFFTRAESSGERHHIRENGEEKLVEFEATVPSCTSFTRYRVDSDLLTAPINRSITDPLFDGSLSFSLPTDKMTEYSVTLTDVNGIDLVFGNKSISTFDIQNMLVSECPGGGCISVSIMYVEGTLSPGALVCVMRIIDGVLNLDSMRLVPICRNMSENFPIYVPNGNYRVIAFDLEKSFLPRIDMLMLMAAAAMNVVVSNSSSEDTTSTPRPSIEGVNATKLRSGDVEVTCSDPTLSCIALYRSSSVLDGALVDFINSTVNSTIFQLMDNYGDGDGYVVVYSWNSSQSIFEGLESFISLLDPTINPQTDPPPDIESTQTDPPPDIESTQTDPPSDSIVLGSIAGIIIIIFIVIVILIVCVCCLRKKRKSKVLQSSQNVRANQDEEQALQGEGAAQEQVCIPLCNRIENVTPEYSTADPPNEDHIEILPLASGEGNGQSPEYETEDSEAPGLPPPYNPAVDNESGDLFLESSMNQGVESQSVDGGGDESVERDQPVRDMDRDGTTEEAIGSTEVLPREMDQSVLEGEGMDTMHELVPRGAEDGARGIADHSGQE